MGYNLYVTRKDEWFDEHGPEIEMDEWVALVEADPLMEMRSEAVVELEGGEQLVAYDPTMAVWLDQAGDVRMWFYLIEGNVVGKNPRPEALAKMHAISELLDARLLGDEGERYDASGTASYPEFETAQTQRAGKHVRPWWKFW